MEFVPCFHLISSVVCREVLFAPCGRQEEEIVIWFQDWKGRDGRFRLFSRFRTFIWVNWHSHSHTSQISTNDFQTSRPTPRCCGGCKASTSRVCGKNLPSWRVTKIYWKFTWIPRFHALMHWFLTERCEKKSPREGCVRIHPAATITSHAAAPTFLWLSDKLAACWMILSA